MLFCMFFYVLEAGVELVAFWDELLDGLEGYSVGDFVYIDYALGE